MSRPRPNSLGCVDFLEQLLIVPEYEGLSCPIWSVSRMVKGWPATQKSAQDRHNSLFSL